MINKQPLKILWLDVETTGLNAKENGIVQIAGILDIDTIPGAEFNYFVQPFDKDVINDDALKIHGHNRCRLKTFEPPQVILRKLTGTFQQFVDKYDKNDKMFIGGQNPSFDRDFLKEWWVKNDIPYFGSWFDYHIIDLCALSMVFHIKGIVDLTDPDTGRINVRLGNVARAFDLEQKEPHDALDDIKLTREIFYGHMLDRFF